MNDWEDRKARRVERLRERAEKARRESESASKAAKDAVAGIPLGQPILVGHHSERRHRAALARQDRNIRKSVEASHKARRLEGRARAAEMNDAVYADDPDAVSKLKEKIESAERLHSKMKRINAEFRRCKGDVDKMDGVSEKVKAEIASTMKVAPWLRTPFDLSNSNANIRRMKARVEELEALDAWVEADPIEGGGWVIEEDARDLRVLVTFDSKPEKETCRMLRSHGFKWSPTRGSWVRHLNAAGRSAARNVAMRLTPVAP